ncbi:MAG TPA: AmmeMemoRadiSam system protein B [Candidatus Paceibacterota bacterium]|nr:AmmeMemoRadiSam system protein B [Candidatus Paceibacterota bacterium]
MKRAIIVFISVVVVGFAWQVWHDAANSARSFHYSYFGEKKYFDDAYAKASLEGPFAFSEPPAALLVNQHLLASHLIAKTFDAAKSNRIKTVFLLTQNNWNAGTAPIITSLYDWKTPYGDIEGDPSQAQQFIKAGLATEDESIFGNEHGITGIVSFIKKSMPNARVIPFVIRDSVPEDQSFALAQMLFEKSRPDTIVVASIDMSHYLPKAESDFHDLKVLETLRTLDFDSTKSLDIDTPPTMRTLMKFAELSGAERFELAGHENSADITNGPGLLSTTSYIDGAYVKGSIAEADPVETVLAMGDVMLDRAVRRHIENFGSNYPWKIVERFFLGNDVTVANLEGSFTSNPSVSEKDSSILHFTFDPSYAPHLAALGFDLFSAANNHAFDFGKKGYEENRSVLAAAGIDSFGSPSNDMNLSFVRTIRGIRVAFIGYHEFYSPNPKPVLDEIARLRSQADFIIVYPHWGVEYNLSASDDQVKLAHGFIDAGADAVIGSHPHVIEPIEVYKGKAIFYSLGNFLFDQDFSERTGQGLAVGVEIRPREVSYDLFPVLIQNSQISFPDIAKRDAILADLSKRSLMLGTESGGILKGKITLTR